MEGSEGGEVGSGVRAQVATRPPTSARHHRGGAMHQMPGGPTTRSPANAPGMAVRLALPAVRNGAYR
ncbi:hypothetical protein ThrDRAFT_01653 [Frankia casuarinae]|jgi:hypothetical protein|nr:hypothetical protein CcI6DRAFT_01270 [Frankia sp. CcI6]EYT92698.1 hypothetical protein ThrDRAFT_01653 [Frankia casuarinae]KDA43633.1 hypothetical protein BMG523Draft_01538 [Frankia sp. BMG5.23]KEZ36941.1 hypothetical protein CEDDRAFT_01709 [Frankia sp. CeD]KFB05098.1 hypothetical protein ALLO2DRAFT_02157 [Frankia sp. Allo2]